MKLLDRYVLRNFIEPFLLCFFGFLAIWLIFDLSDNGPDFIQARASVKMVGRYYLMQLPQIIMISLPVGLLLALLFCLSRMSRFNEIISMLTAGRSMVRVLMPLILVSLLLSGALLALNYELAPRAEALREVAIEQINNKRKPGDIEAIRGYLFRDRMNERTWYVNKFRTNSMQFEGVHITQQDASGRITRKWYAGGAFYDPRTKVWTLIGGVIFDFDEAGDVAKIDDFQNGHRQMTDWTETPSRIQSARSDAKRMTVPELREFLANNADFPAVQLAPYRTYQQHRLALPMQCAVVVLLAGPLAIVFSRRGVVGGVAAAMGLYATFLLTTYLFLALGKGARLNPVLAAWIPSAIFLFIGLVLLYFRGSNREFRLLPK
jgi:LPS export ABC transporter permease LptG